MLTCDRGALVFDLVVVLGLYLCQSEGVSSERLIAFLGVEMGCALEKNRVLVLVLVLVLVVLVLVVRRCSGLFLIK